MSKGEAYDNEFLNESREANGLASSGLASVCDADSSGCLLSDFLLQADGRTDHCVPEV